MVIHVLRVSVYRMMSTGTCVNHSSLCSHALSPGVRKNIAFVRCSHHRRALAAISESMDAPVLTKLDHLMGAWWSVQVWSMVEWGDSSSSWKIGPDATITSIFLPVRHHLPQKKGSRDGVEPPSCLYRTHAIPLHHRDFRGLSWELRM